MLWQVKVQPQSWWKLQRFSSKNPGCLRGCKWRGRKGRGCKGRGAGGRVFIYGFPVYLLHHCLFPNSVACGRSEFGASENGEFCSSTVQKYLPRFLSKLCKPDLLMADRNPSLRLPWGHFTEGPSSQPVQQQHRHILPSVVASWAAQTVSGNRWLFASPICYFHPQLDLAGWWAGRKRLAEISLSSVEDQKCVHSWHPPGVDHMVPAHMFHLWWPQSHLPEEIQLFSKERGLLWNWSHINQPVDGDFQNS